MPQVTTSPQSVQKVPAFIECPWTIVKGDHFCVKIANFALTIISALVTGLVSIGFMIARAVRLNSNHETTSTASNETIDPRQITKRKKGKRSEQQDDTAQREAEEKRRAAETAQAAKVAKQQSEAQKKADALKAAAAEANDAARRAGKANAFALITAQDILKAEARKVAPLPNPQADGEYKQELTSYIINYLQRSFSSSDPTNQEALSKDTNGQELNPDTANLKNTFPHIDRTFTPETVDTFEPLSIDNKLLKDWKQKHPEYHNYFISKVRSLVSNLKCIIIGSKFNINQTIGNLKNLKKIIGDFKIPKVVFKGRMSEEAFKAYQEFFDETPFEDRTDPFLALMAQCFSYNDGNHSKAHTYPGQTHKSEKEMLNQLYKEYIEKKELTFDTESYFQRKEEFKDYNKTLKALFYNLVEKNRNIVITYNSGRHNLTDVKKGMKPVLENCKKEITFKDLALKTPPTKPAVDTATPQATTAITQPPTTTKSRHDDKRPPASKAAPTTAVNIDENGFIGTLTYPKGPTNDNPIKVARNYVAKRRAELRKKPLAKNVEVFIKRHDNLMTDLGLNEKMMSSLAMNLMGALSHTGNVFPYCSNGIIIYFNLKPFAEGIIRTFNQEHEVGSFNRIRMHNVRKLLTSNYPDEIKDRFIDLMKKHVSDGRQGVYILEISLEEDLVLLEKLMNKTIPNLANIQDIRVNRNATPELMKKIHKLLPHAVISNSTS